MVEACVNANGGPRGMGKGVIWDSIITFVLRKEANLANSDFVAVESSGNLLSSAYRLENHRTILSTAFSE
jgi:hypothetical protein